MDGNKDNFVSSGIEVTPDQICLGLSLHPVVTTILQKRGYGTKDEMNRYLNATLNHLHHPGSIPGIKDLGDVIKAKMKEGVFSAIFCDYDVDGITAAVILYLALSRLTHNPPIIFPSLRSRDGYGLSREAIELLNAKKIQFLMTVDCGISNHQEIKLAQEKGIEVVIIDHHECFHPPQVPFINLKVEAGEYPFPNLSGAALTWKLAQVILQDPLVEFLDLVALATIADVVELKDENRIMVKEGLLRLKKGEGNPGLMEILSLKGIELSSLHAYHLGYQVAPLLNAVGRLGSPSQAINLLLTDSLQERRMLAVALNQANEERRALTSDAVNKALIEVNPNDRVLMYKSTLHSGILGLVASELREQFGKAAIVIGEGERGSCRSVPPLNMYKLLRDCSGYLVTHGGHSMAAGMTLKDGCYEDFYQKVQFLARDVSYQNLVVDQEIPLEEVTRDLLEDLSLMEPFGSGNLPPIFQSSSISTHKVRILPGGHLSFEVKDRKFIGYRMKEMAPLARKGPLTLIYSPAIAKGDAFHLKTFFPT